MPFLACEIYKNEVFAIDINDDIWRFTLEYVDQQVIIQKFMGNEVEYCNIIALLRAKAYLYK